MTRNVALILGATMLAVAAGCKAPTPVFDPLAGYGRATVPPPATGSFGRPDSYYNGGAAPATNTGSQLPMAATNAYATNVNPPAASALNQDAGYTQPGGLNWRAAGTASQAAGTLNVAATAPSLSPVQQAAHTAPVQQAAQPGAVAQVSHLQPVAPVAATGNATPALALQGMPVNDATVDARTAALPLLRHYPAGYPAPATYPVTQATATQPVTAANAPQIIFPQGGPALPAGTPVNTPYGTGYVVPAQAPAVAPQATLQPVTVQPNLAPVNAAAPASTGLQWHQR